MLSVTWREQDHGSQAMSAQMYVRAHNMLIARYAATRLYLCRCRVNMNQAQHQSGKVPAIFPGVRV